MGTEGYRPTEEEMQRAENSMSDEQKAFSKTRESILIDPETKERYAKYIETVRNGAIIPRDIFGGPEDFHGMTSEPFEGYNQRYGHLLSRDNLPKFRELLSKDAFDRIAEIFETYEDLEKKGNTEPEEGWVNTKIYIEWLGSAIQAPTMYTGRGSYYSYKEYDNCWMAYSDDQDEYDDTNVSDKGIEYTTNFYIALKMTNEQKEEYLQSILERFGISEDQIKH